MSSCLHYDRIQFFRFNRPNAVVLFFHLFIRFFLFVSPFLSYSSSFSSLLFVLSFSYTLFKLFFYSSFISLLNFSVCLSAFQLTIRSNCLYIISSFSVYTSFYFRFLFFFSFPLFICHCSFQQFVIVFLLVHSFFFLFFFSSSSRFFFFHCFSSYLFFSVTYSCSFITFSWRSIDIFSFSFLLSTKLILFRSDIPSCSFFLQSFLHSDSFYFKCLPLFFFLFLFFAALFFYILFIFLVFFFFSTFFFLFIHGIWDNILGISRLVLILLVLLLYCSPYFS